jgi:erythromycin esterase
MKTIIICIALQVSFTAFTFAQQSGLQPFQSINPKDENFTDLQFLKTEIGDKQIVMIGEQDHFAGASIDAKARIANFLIKEMGFEVILFEAGFYDVKRSIEYAKINNNNKAIPASLYFLWAKNINIAQFLDSMAYNVSRNKLSVDGFDPKFTSVFAGMFFMSDVEAEIKKIGFQYDDSGEWQQYKTIIQKAADKYDKQIISLKEDEKLLIRKVAGRLSDAFKKAGNDYWAQLVNANAFIIVEYSDVRIKDLIAGNVKSQILDSRRDSIMAENAIWLLKNKYKNKKVIIWAASYHITKSPEILVAEESKHSFQNKIILGNEIGRTFSSQVYNIGFISYQGKYGVAFDKPKGDKIMPHSANSIEEYVSKFKYPFCYLSLNKLEGINKMTASINGFNNKGYSSSDWFKNFDGIIYIETMYPNTLK